eukprot:3338340-Lingulodinium_polyedra.AAC.1
MSIPVQMPIPTKLPVATAIAIATRAPIAKAIARQTNGDCNTEDDTNRDNKAYTNSNSSLWYR